MGMDGKGRSMDGSVGRLGRAGRLGRPGRGGRAGRETLGSAREGKGRSMDGSAGRGGREGSAGSPGSPGRAGSFSDGRGGRVHSEATAHFSFTAVDLMFAGGGTTGGVVGEPDTPLVCVCVESQI